MQTQRLAMRRREPTPSRVRAEHLRSTLTRNHGNVAAAARSLGLRYDQVHAQMKEHDLVSFAAALRAERRAARCRAIVDLLVKHRGSFAKTARDLGIATSS